MSKASEGYRKAAKAKLGRLLRTDPLSKIDASGYTPPDALDADVKTGARPLTKRLYKRGGHVKGDDAHHHAGRKARKSGGKAITADSLINRDVREANEERAGTKHVGAFNKGGAAKHPDEAEDRALIRKMVKPEARTGKADGGEKWISKAIKHPGALHKSLHVPAGKKIPAKKLEKAAHSDKPKLAKRAHLAETLKGMHKAHGGDCTCHRCMGGKMTKSHGGQAEEVTGTRPTGGRTARATGGKAGKGKMNVNIIIAGHGHHDQQQPMMPPAAQPAAPVTMPRPPMPPAGGPPMGGMPMPVPMPMQAAAPPPANVPPMRASGGGVFPRMENGGGGGLGRLEKIRKYGP